MKGKTADFLEHVLATAAFGCQGGFMLGLSLWRALAWKKRRPVRTYSSSGNNNRHDNDISFAETYIPERNPGVLRLMGVYLVSLASFGIATELWAGVYLHGDVLFLLHHVVYYGVFYPVGVAAILESQQRLPPDTHRILYAVALLMTAIIMRERTFTQTEKYSRNHTVLLQLHLANALAFAYSVRFPKSVVANIMGWALMTLTGFWYFTMGLINDYWDYGRVGTIAISTYFGLELTAFALVIILVVAYCVEPVVSARRSGDDLPAEDELEISSLLSGHMGHSDSRTNVENGWGDDGDGDDNPSPA